MNKQNKTVRIRTFGGSKNLLELVKKVLANKETVACYATPNGNVFITTEENYQRKIDEAYEQGKKEGKKLKNKNEKTK